MGEIPKKESKLSEIVADYVRRNFHCKVITELKLPGCIFDIVGFNPDTEDFYVVETKLGHKPASIGHAFGQVLAYQAVISQNGYDFMKRLFERLASEGDSVPIEVIKRVLSEQTVNVYRYVALTDEACRNHQLIKDLRARLTAAVGVIRYDGKRCRDYIRIDGRNDSDICESEPITIGIAKLYERKEFFAEIKRRMLKRYPNLTFSKHPDANPRYIQLRIGHRGYHLESHATNKRVTRSLDVELDSRREKEEFFKFARNVIKKAKKTVPGLAIQRNWGGSGKWGRVIQVEPSPVYDDDLVERTVTSLSDLYDSMKPAVESFTAARKSGKGTGRGWIEVYMDHKGKRYEAEFNLATAKMRMDGHLYSSPSALSREITESPRNGWRDWRYTGRGGNILSIDSLRTR